MKSRILLLFGIVALLSVFTYQSCEVVKTDTPDQNVTEFTQSIIVKGTVTSADNGTAISGVSVSIDGNEVISDFEGAYELIADEMPASGSLVTVSADGYVVSSGVIDYDELIPTIYVMDFALSRELPANFINLTTGGIINLDGIKVEVPANNGATLNGVTLESVEISVSPISPITTLGNWVGATLKTLKFEPAGVEFNIPVKFYIDTPEDFVYEGYSIYSYNETTNTWDVLNNEISFENDQVVFELKIFAGGIKLADPASINITSDITGSDAAIRFDEGNCNCDGPMTNTPVGYYFRKLSISENPGESYVIGVLSELNSMHFFTNNNLPYNAAIVSGIVVYPATMINLDYCELAEVDIIPIYREITGTYEYQVETKEFVIKYIFGATTAVNFVDCPTTSQCHQGCPVI